MVKPIVLASSSKIRGQLLAQSGVPFDVLVSRIDEESIKDALLSEGATPRDICDALAEGKARKASFKAFGSLVIGCDQVLSFKGKLISKPKDKDEARAHLQALNGERHKLLSAAVIYEDGEPKWRHIGEVRLQMKKNSQAYLDEYLERNWESIRESVGGYKLEEEGSRLFARIDGDYFNVLGLPLLELLSYLGQREVIPS